MISWGNVPHARALYAEKLHDYSILAYDPMPSAMRLFNPAFFACLSFDTDQVAGEPKSVEEERS